MSFSPQIDEALRQSVRVFEGMGLRYAVGGAVAMAFGGYPRGTRDVDILILLPALRSQELADALNTAGFRMHDERDQPTPVDVLQMVKWSRDIGHFRVWWKEIKVEIFTPRVPLQDAVLKRRLQVSLGNETLWITTAEDLILLKMIFHRPKDLEDVRRLIAANRETLDRGYIESWIPKTLPDAVGQELGEMLKAASA